MNRINRNNYESYLIDLMEGNLDARTTEEVMLFLDANPDIKEEFAEFENVAVEPVEVTFEDKSALKQKEVLPVGSVSEENYETKFIAYYEHDLSLLERKDVEQFVKLNPDLKKEFVFFGKLIISKDESIVFAGKDDLYKRRKAIPLFWISSAAAVFLVLISVVGLLKYDVFELPQPDVNKVAQVVPVTSSPDQKDKENKEEPVSPSENIKTEEVQKVPVKEERVEIQNSVVEPKSKLQPRAYALLEEMPSSKVNIRLTSDEVYCRFKYRDAMADTKAVNPEKSKSLVGKLIAGLFNKAKKRIVPVVSEGSGEPLMAQIFDGGARILNDFTGTEANVTKYYDNRGNLIAYQFSGGRLNFSKQFRPPTK